MRIVKDLAKWALGERNLGRLEFFRYPDLRHPWGGPFNGQRFRRRIFFDLLYCLPVKAIVETGTFYGTTTALFAATTLPVYSVEINQRCFGYAQMRFLFQRDSVHLYHGDSRSFLKELSADRSVPKEDVFFYLDAHWQDDLPLREELEIIFSQWQRPIVMVDDFRVPDFSYSFDDYGPGKALDLQYVEPVVSAHRLAALFPAVDAAAETGAKRGSVVLCHEASVREIEARIATLARAASSRHDNIRQTRASLTTQRV